MKKRIILFVLLVSISGLYWNCERKIKEPVAFERRIVLVNPSLGYFNSIVSMMKNHVIDLPHTELLTVHYAKTSHGYESIQQFLIENPLPYVRQEQIQGDLDEENIFRENSCTDDFSRLFLNSDGILFFGGADFPPSVYGQKTNLLTSIHTPYRHYFELSFLFHLLGGSQNPDYQPLLEQNPKYVIRGFCLGMQSINVASGGTMFQDIPSEIYGLKFVEDVLALDSDKMHRNYWRNLSPRENLIWCNFHRIRFIEEEFFTDFMNLDPGFTPYVCSSHHQAVHQLGKDIRIAATSMDGEIVEAVTHERYPNVLGVQFHPEAFSIYDPEADKHAITSSDTILVSEYDFLKQDESLEFHRKFWSQFSDVILKSEK